MRTWQIELAVVASILLAVFVLAGKSSVELIGSLAVLFTFATAQVATRFSEAVAEYEVKHGVTIVTCHAWYNRYFLAKEFLWLLYFVLLGAWSALVGVFVFLVYPAWRTWYRGIE